MRPSTGRHHTWINPRELGYQHLGDDLSCRDCGVIRSELNRNADNCPGRVEVALRREVAPAVAPGWRKAPPSVDEVRAWSWWWNRSPGVGAHVLQLDVDNGLIIDVGEATSSDCGGRFDPGAWPGQWAPCLPPDAPRAERPVMSTHIWSGRSYYVASSRDGVADVRELSRRLDQLGMVNLLDWPSHLDHTCSDVVCGIRDRARLAMVEVRAAAGCGLFVGLHRMGRGAHVELGAAIHACLSIVPKRVVLVGCDPADSALYCHPVVEHVASVPDVIQLLDRGLWRSTDEVTQP